MIANYSIPPAGMLKIGRVVIDIDPNDAILKPSDKFLEGCNGAIHVGGNIGQEAPVYNLVGLKVAWIEAVPEICDALREYAGKFGHLSLNYLVTDKDGEEYDFGIANNGQSSSIFNMAEHAKFWPAVQYIGSIKLESATLETIIRRHSLQWADVLVMDVQAAELKVLQGAGDLSQFKFIKAEAASCEIYENGCTLDDLDEFLKGQYLRIETWEGVSLDGVGRVCDAVYRRI